MVRPEYLLGLDIGYRHDYSALATLERREVNGQSTYDVTGLDRWRDRRSTDTPALLRPLYQKIRKVEFEADVEEYGRGDVTTPRIVLIVDETGGIGAVDILHEANLRPVPIWFTGGDQVTTGEHGGYRVPKRKLAGIVAQMTESRRLHVVPTIPHAATLKAELENFKAGTKLSGHDIYGAGQDWRVGNHDDMVFAVAIALWWGEKARNDGILRPASDFLRRAFGEVAGDDEPN